MFKAVGSGPVGSVMAEPNVWLIMKNGLLRWFSSLSKLRKRKLTGEKSELKP